MSMFQKATKRAVRARVAIDGPSGSGKTYTALEWARILGKRVAVIDTERGSASLYSDIFDFDVLEISPPFHPDRFVDAIRDAEKAGYEVLIIDSLSHAWEGEGGVLDIVDAAASRQNGNSYTAWKSGTPILRHLIDTVLATDMHVLVTMRSKTEYVLEENDRGKTTPRKVGMAPVMRAGAEYEFTLVGDMDLEHRMTITKSRCPALSDLVVQPGRAAEAAETFVNWTQSGAGMASRNDIDALKRSFNEIDNKDLRVAAKKAFGDQFGNPEYLLADRLDEARAFIAGYGTPDPAPSAEPAPAAPAAPAEPAPAPVAGRGPTPPPKLVPTPEGDEKITPADASKLHAYAHRKADPASKVPDVPLDNDTFRVLVFGVTGGATDSSGELTRRQADDLEQRVRQARQGKFDVNHDHVYDLWAAYANDRKQVTA
jgi:hypothetical protein